MKEYRNEASTEMGGINSAGARLRGRIFKCALYIAACMNKRLSKKLGGRGSSNLAIILMDYNKVCFWPKSQVFMG